jgi:hypothetical protein
MHFRNRDFENRIRELQLQTCRECIHSLVQMHNQHADVKDIMETVTNILVGTIGTLINPDHFGEVIDHIHGLSANKLEKLRVDMGNGMVDATKPVRLQ